MDSDFDDGIDEAFKGFGETPAKTTAISKDVPVPPPIAEPPKTEEPKKDEQTPPATANKEEAVPPADPADKPEEKVEPPETPETPPAPEDPPAPLTKEDVTSAITELLDKERSSEQALEGTVKELMDANYPDGLSNILIDQKSGKELKTPQDVVDAAAMGNVDMSIEDAAQWLINEQYKLDKQITEIKDNVKSIAETTFSFKRDTLAALAKYEPLFKAYPQLQTKTFDKLMKQVRTDDKKNAILFSPDVMEFYDDMLEPYRLAFEYSQQQSATALTDPPVADPVKPDAGDRLDVGGDGGVSDVDDPDDFAQQVNKELARGL